MNWDAISAIGQIVGALAVVVTLIYLAVQIRVSQVGSTSASTYSAMEAYSRWRANILQNPDVAEAVVKTNRGETLTDCEQLYVQMLADELFIVVTVGATESEGWGLIDRKSVDLEYLKLFFEENPGLIPYWYRYRRIATLVSEDYVLAVDDLVTKIKGKDESAQ